MKTLVIVLAILAVLFLGVGLYIRKRLDGYFRSGNAYIPGTQQWRNPAIAAAYHMEMVSFVLAGMFLGIAVYLFNN